MDNALTIADIRGVIRRRWWMPALTLAFGTPLAVAVAMALPPVYASTARILVESQVIPEELARSTVAQSAAERIELLRQQLLTRQNLLEIADQNNAFARRQDLSPSDIVTLMKDATTIRGTSASGSRRDRTVTGIDIIFRSDRPAVAARVANDLVSRILTQNAASRSDRAASTLAFFDQEVQRLQREVTAKGAEIESYKAQEQISLPESLQTRQAEASQLREQRFSLAAQKATLEEQQRTLERSIASGAPRPGERLSPQQQELQQLRNALIAQGAILSETHPTIRQMRARIAAIESSIGETARATNGSVEEMSVDERLVELNAQRNAIIRQVDVLDRQLQANEARIEELDASIARTPTVQIRVESLQRAYNALQTQLIEASVKRNQAELGERLEASQQAERFLVIEQAIAPDEPMSPNRPAIIAAGMFVSGALGAGLMVLVEMFRRPLRAPRDLERRLELHPIATVPYIRSEAEVRRRLWLRRTFIVAVLGGPATVLAGVHFLIMPLPEAATRFVDASGIAKMIDDLSLRFGR